MPPPIIVGSSPYFLSTGHSFGVARDRLISGRGGPIPSQNPRSEPCRSTSGRPTASVVLFFDRLHLRGLGKNSSPEPRAGGLHKRPAIHGLYLIPAFAQARYDTLVLRWLWFAAAAAAVLALAPESSVPFEDRSAASGITVVLKNGATPEKHQIETMPGGVAMFDYDGDGRARSVLLERSAGRRLDRPDETGTTGSTATSATGSSKM